MAHSVHAPYIARAKIEASPSSGNGYFFPTFRRAFGSVPIAALASCRARFRSSPSSLRAANRASVFSASAFSCDRRIAHDSVSMLAGSDRPLLSVAMLGESSPRVARVPGFQSRRA